MSDKKSKFSDDFNEAFRTGRYIKRDPEIHPLSTTSVMLEMRRREGVLAKGTGWFWRQNSGIALVSAWHNFSGLHHTERTMLSKLSEIPDSVYVRFMTKGNQTFQDHLFPLYIDDDRLLPRWHVHPVCGNYFDMSFLPLAVDGGDVHCINDFISIGADKPRPMQDVFAVGYPLGVNMMSLFPLWKRGTVASDVDLAVEGHPKFLVDMPGRSGLSGAPVFRSRNGLAVGTNDDGSPIRVENTVEFIGLYSGRSAGQLPSVEQARESTDLGFVWHAEVVMEMLEHGVPDEQPEVGKGKLEVRALWKNA